jgi:multiple antibiotic resistance protein
VDEAMAWEWALAFAVAFVPLFVVVDPLASIGLYLGLTARHDRMARNRIALKACVFAAAVLVAFAIAGQGLLRYLGIELYSLKAAGGILLTLIGLSMLKEGEEVPQREIAEGELVPVVTGAISLVIVQSTTIAVPVEALAIIATMFGALVVLLVASRASHVINDNARRVITRIMGLLTVAFAIQYVFDGVDGWLASR